jgi:hypothetical protein
MEKIDKQKVVRKIRRFRKTTGGRISLDPALSKDGFTTGEGAGGDLARGDAALPAALPFEAAEFGIAGLSP